MVTVGQLIPGGFRKLDVVDAIGDESGVALMVEGDADGINGRYANKYVFVFKFSAGQILSLLNGNTQATSACRNKAIQTKSRG